ncbi:MAG: N-acetylmuramoyl-L-alanine amidase [Clostridia bacterium]|nr:N-acetylmuramoyl-L-alanine amidase [Clostridia bacterium]
MKKIVIIALAAFLLTGCAVAAVRPDVVIMSTYDIGDEQQEKTLEGLIIGIDPGHQAKANNEREPIAPGSSETKIKVSSGTAGVSTRTAEHVVNLQIGLLLRDALEARGATVIMTRETADVDISNIERATMMNEAGADLCLRLHCNGSTDRSANGSQMFVRRTGAMAEESAQAAEIIVECMCAHTGARNRGIVRNDNYTGLNWSEVPSILVEMGFMSNPQEDEQLSDPQYQQKLVDGMVEGIEKYFGRETAQEE